MRYAISFDKLANQLMPYFWGGRKVNLFVQSILYPLKAINDKFVLFANEAHIEARMTSQVMYFEWYLNHRFRKYFVNQSDRISIIDSTSLGVGLFYENAANGIPFTVWYNNENTDSVADPAKKPKAFYLRMEEKAVNKVSFMVSSPEVTISQPEFVYMLSFAINSYCIAGKTFLIKINGLDVDSNNNTII